MPTKEPKIMNKLPIEVAELIREGSYSLFQKRGEDVYLIKTSSNVFFEVSPEGAATRITKPTMSHYERVMLFDMAAFKKIVNG